MSYWVLGAQVGAQALGAYASWAAAKEQAKVEKTVAKMQNRVLAVQGAQARNVLNRNRAYIRQDLASAAQGIEQNTLEARGAATVSAGASGTTGNSVLRVLSDISREDARAKYNLLQDATRQEAGLQQADRDISMQIVSQKAGVTTVGTNPLSLLAGVGSTGLLTAADTLAKKGR